MTKPGLVIYTILPIALILSAGASSRVTAETGTPTPAEAIRAVIEADDRLGTERNHATEIVSIARAVEVYVEGLDALDLQNSKKGSDPISE